MPRQRRTARQSGGIDALAGAKLDKQDFAVTDAGAVVGQRSHLGRAIGRNAQSRETVIAAHFEPAGKRKQVARRYAGGAGRQFKNAGLAHQAAYGNSLAQRRYQNAVAVRELEVAGRALVGKHAVEVNVEGPATALDAHAAQRTRFLYAAGKHQRVHRRCQARKDALARNIDFTRDLHSDLTYLGNGNKGRGGNEGAAHRGLHICAEIREPPACGRNGIEARQDNLAVAIDDGAQFGIFLSACGNQKFVTASQNVIVLYRAGLRHGDGAALTKLVIAKLLQLRAGPSRQDLF